MNNHNHSSQARHQMENGNKPAKHDMHMGHKKVGGHQAHHAMMAADFKRRFWVSLAMTLPVLLLSPLIRELLGITELVAFNGDTYLLWALSTIIFFYGGLPFLKGIFSELKSKNPGMMTLIALAITVAYAYSSAVIFGLTGKVFFWELAKSVKIL